MKKLLTIFAVLFATMLVACSEENSPKMQGGIDVSHIDYLSRDGSVSTYNLTGIEEYSRTQNGEWTPIIRDEIVLGGDINFEETMSFQDGKLWRPVTLFSTSYGPFPVSDVWRAYCKVNGEDKDLYVAVRFEYDEQNKILKMGDVNMQVMEFTENKLVLNYEYNSGHNRDIGYFEKVTPVRFDGKNTLQFDNDYECYLYIAKKGREQFGRYINLNEVFKGLVIYDDPIVDMDIVDAWLEEYKKQVLDKGLKL